MARPHRPADPERVGARLAAVLTPPPSDGTDGLDAVLPDPLEDLDAAIAAARTLDT